MFIASITRLHTGIQAALYRHTVATWYATIYRVPRSGFDAAGRIGILGQVREAFGLAWIMGQLACAKPAIPVRAGSGKRFAPETQIATRPMSVALRE